MRILIYCSLVLLVLRPNVLAKRRFQNPAILSLITFLTSLSGIFAQENLPYKPWKDFNGDTVQYLDYNFYTRESQYHGKKASAVLDDLELPITHVGEVVKSIGLHNSDIKPCVVSVGDSYYNMKPNIFT
ncbi:MAG: hypothetical protein LBR67_06385 [Dysgonamonadaceae bacterium]|jgi:hypothetical protein|nr:hypothetical protein [Dysgonamonadaceae bacterium]